MVINRSCYSLDTRDLVYHPNIIDNKNIASSNRYVYYMTSQNYGFHIKLCASCEYKLQVTDDRPTPPTIEGWLLRWVGS